MNDLPPKDAGAKTGSGATPPMAGRPLEKPGGQPSAGNAPAPALPPVQIGKPGYKFTFPAESPQGQEERREHERIRKSEKRRVVAATEPPPLPAPPLVATPQAPAGVPVAGNPVAPGEMAPADFVPWVAADIADLTDELVELSEAKRVADFVAVAREAHMPPRFIAQIEKDSGYRPTSKAALKRTLADCAAKWLNKTGVSSKSREEVKLLFVAATIRMQGVRLKRDLLALIETDKARRAAEAKPEPKPETKPKPDEDAPAFVVVK